MTRPPAVFRGLTALLGAVEPFTRRLARFQQGLAPTDLWFAEQALERSAEELRGFFATHDLWLSATLTRPSPSHGELNLRGSDASLEQQLFGLIGFMPVANATGVPAISLPAGFSTEGLPIGMHLTGPQGREDRLLTVAGQWERAEPWPLVASVSAHRGPA